MTHSLCPSVQFFGSIPEAVSHARAHFNNVLKVIATELKAGDGDYLLGADFSAVDILFVHCLGWAESIEWLPDALVALEPDVRQCLEQYLARCRSRAAFQRAATKQESAL